MPKRRKKKKTQSESPEDEVVVPRSIVFRRGKAGAGVKSLVQDLRRVMSPYTALDLKESKKNTLKDFVSVAPHLKVTHFLMLQQTVMGVNLRVTRVPRGPTLTFKVDAYSLMYDITKMQRKPHSPGTEYDHSPLLVLNHFAGDQVQLKLMTAVFQNMFPQIDVATIKLHECRRVVLMNRDPSTGQIEMRHYVINASPVGMNKNIKRIVQAKIPDLSKLEDISELLYQDNVMTSDSEAEDTNENRISLAQDFAGRGNRKAGRSAVRLKEVGPRLSLSLLKIEEGFCEGRVLYHSKITKTAEELSDLKKRRQTGEDGRARRRAEQEANVARKNKLRNKLPGKRGHRERADAQKRTGGSDESDVDGVEAPKAEKEPELDDADWYKIETGEEADPEMFAKSSAPAAKPKVGSKKGKGGDKRKRGGAGGPGGKSKRERR